MVRFLFYYYAFIITHFISFLFYFYFYFLYLVYFYYLFFYLFILIKKSECSALSFSFGLHSFKFCPMSKMLFSICKLQVLPLLHYFEFHIPFLCKLNKTELHLFRSSQLGTLKTLITTSIYTL